MDWRGAVKENALGLGAVEGVMSAVGVWQVVSHSRNDQSEAVRAK